VTIPGSITSLGDGVFFDCSIFQGCSELTQIIVDDKNTQYSSLDGVLFNKDQSTLLQCPIGKTGSYMIPDSVTSIGDSAFSECKGLTGVAIPESVISIGGLAFSGCTGFNNVAIPDNVTSIGDSAFSRCTSLTSVAIPDSMTSIGEEVFSLCTGLTSVTIPDSVTSIGFSAFSQCTSLTSVTIPGSVTSIGGVAFTFCSGLKSVYFYGDAPVLGDGAFTSCASGLTVYYRADKTGFTNPWYGYAATTFMPTATELANIEIAAAKALLPADFTAIEGIHANLLDYLNAIAGIDDAGTILTLASSNANVADNGAITYTGSQVAGEIEVHISKAGGTEETKTISVTIPALMPNESLSNNPNNSENTSSPAGVVSQQSNETGTPSIVLIIAGVVLVVIIILRIIFRKKSNRKAPVVAAQANTSGQNNPQSLYCIQCGARIIPNTKFCAKCGKPVY
jgi:hypothetical protein